MAKILIMDAYAAGLTNFRGHLLTSLVKEGHEVIAIAPDIDKSIAGKLKSIGVKHLDISMQRTGLNPWADLCSFAEIYRIVKKSRPDVGLFYSAKPIVYGVTAGALGGIKVRSAMITGLGYTFVARTLKGRLISMVQRLLYSISLRLAHYIFFQNPDDYADCQALGLCGRRSKVVFINGSGVDIDYFSRQPLPDKLSFLMIGRLISAKGVREYCLAAGIVKKTHPEVRFCLVGWFDVNSPDALSENELDKLVKENGVEYLGRLADVRAALAECSVYVLPSYREGTPRSVLEALSVGRPIITTDTPGCRETVIDGVNGLLVPVRDYKALAEAMKRIADAPDMIATCANESRKLAEKKYDARIVNKTIIDSLELQGDSS